MEDKEEGRERVKGFIWRMTEYEVNNIIRSHGGSALHVHTESHTYTQANIPSEMDN